MKRSVKIILYLFISVCLCGAFTFFAFTHLFTLIETGIYYPNLRAGAEKETNTFASAVTRYLENALQAFQGTAKQEYLWRSYQSQQTAGSIRSLTDGLSGLFADFPKLELRLVDPPGKRIFYSTREADIKNQTPGQRMYKNWNEVEPALSPERVIARPQEPPRLVWDGAGQRLLFAFPVTGPDGKFYGSAVFTVPRIALEDHLIIKEKSVYRSMRILDAGGLVIDLSGSVSLSGPPEDSAALESSVAETWRDVSPDALVQQVVILGNGKSEGRYFLYLLGLKAGGGLGILFPVQRFEMGVIDKGIVLAVFYVTVILMVFLLGNLKQDPLRIVASRMHRFQVEFLREFFEKKDQIDIGRWQREIDSRRDEIKRYMKKGIRKLPSGKETEIDAYIIDSWNEVVSIIKSKIQKPPEGDLARIETLLRKLLEEGRIVVASRPKAVSDQAPPVSVKERPATTAPPAAEEAVSAAEEISELEEVPEATEAVSAVEELEPLEEAVPESAVPITRPSAAPAAAEELTELEPAGVEEVEELEEIEELTEAEEATGEPVQAMSVKASAGLAGARGAVQADQGEIETLSVVPEIKELPPLPFEQLEELEAIDQEERKSPIDTVAYKEFLSCLKTGTIKILELSDALLSLVDAESHIVMDGGVYRIKEDLFKGIKSGLRQRGLKALAQSLLEEKDTGISSIDELYGSGEFLEEAEKRSIQEKISVARKTAAAVKKLVLTPRGIDLDRYMESFAYQVTDKVMIYAIGELIKKAKAVSSVLFMKEKGLRVSLAIGLTNRSANLFYFQEDEPFFINHLAKKQIVIIDNVFQKMKLFTQRLSADDVKFIRSGIFIPALLERRETYFFLGFTNLDAVKDSAQLFKKMDFSPA